MLPLLVLVTADGQIRHAGGGQTQGYIPVRVSKSRRGIMSNLTT